MEVDRLWEKKASIFGSERSYSRSVEAAKTARAASSIEVILIRVNARCVSSNAPR